MIRNNKRIVVNFVMSNDVYSDIFEALIRFFKEFLPENIELYVSKYPLPNADVYHYHRPNLESSLKDKSVVTVHHDLNDTDPWFDSHMFVDRYHEASRIVCLNSRQLEILKVREGIDNSVLIPHGVDPSIFDNSHTRSFEDGKFTIGVVSKRYARRVKGEAYLYEMYKRLNPDKICFVFVGEGRTIDKLESESFGFSSTVYESLPYRLFNDLYKDIDVLIVPSLFEGGPANIPEAVYCGVPILGRDIAMIHDYVDHKINGYFLTGNFDIDSSLINDLSVNKKEVFANLLNSIQNSKKQFISWEEVVLRHAIVYREVAESNVAERLVYDL
jgi:glycosyltransferase involved in cell wall biosynthesis